MTIKNKNLRNGTGREFTIKASGRKGRNSEINDFDVSEIKLEENYESTGTLLSEVDSHKGEKEQSLTETQKKYLTQILMLTGREERLEREPLLTRKQSSVYTELLQFLLTSNNAGQSQEAKCGLFNRILLVLGIKPISDEFFRAIFGNLDFSDLSEFGNRVELFRKICMLEYGNFRFGYKILRGGKDLNSGLMADQLRSIYFPTDYEVEKNKESFNKKARSVGLIQIEPGLSFVLGYISGEFAKKVSESRARLSEILTSAISGKKVISDYDGLCNYVEENSAVSRKDFDQLVRKSAIASEDRILYPAYYAAGLDYSDLIRNAIKQCVSITQTEIDTAKSNGELNTTIYLTMHDIDVYMATSMRDPIHFTSNSSFISSLFGHELLKELNLRFFDPTQSFLEDRIQKGLVESLMIKRSRVTVYNAQETDSFGKDSEASVALSQGKDVIVYVARLFSDNEEFLKLYSALDNNSSMSLDDFLKQLIHKEYLKEEEIPMFTAPGKTKGDCIETVAKRASESLLAKLEKNVINAELAHYGYRCENDDELPQFVSNLIARLEKRALTFKEVHPLSFQISAENGVARGVFVVRSVDHCAMILSGLLLGGLEYDLSEDKFNYILTEKITRTPIRVVVKEPTLTAAFWTEFARRT